MARKIKNNPYNEIATAEQSIEYFINTLGYLPDPDMVLRKAGKDFKIYRELETDAHVTAVMVQRKAGALSKEWDIDRGKAKSREAKFILDILNSFDMHEIMNDILDAVFYGMSVFEIIWKNDNGKIMPASFIAKPQEWFAFSPQRELLFKSRATPLGEPVPANKFIVARNNPKYMNPYGERLLSKCFWPVTFKRGGLKFWVLFAEKFGMPHVIGKQPRGVKPEATKDFLQSLEQMIMDAVAVIPDDSSVEFLQTTGKDGAAYEKLLNFCNDEISKAILTATLTTDINGAGSYASAKVHEDKTDYLYITDKLLIENTINELIRLIYYFNFPSSGNLPKFTLYEEQDVELDTATRDKTLTETGVKFTKEYYKKVYGFEDEDFEINDTTPQVPGQNNMPQAGRPSQKEEDTKQNFAEAQKKANTILALGDISKLLTGQKGIDKLANAFSDSELQEQMNVFVKPILELISNSNDFNEVSNNIATLYPKLDTTEIQEVLTKAILISDIWGQVNARA